MSRKQVGRESIERAIAILGEGDLIQIGGAGWWRFISPTKRFTQWERRVHTRTLNYLVADGTVAITRRGRWKIATLVRPSDKP